MYCRKCGQKISEDSAYCAKCGEKVEIPFRPSPVPVPSPEPVPLPKNPWAYRFNSEWRSLSRSPLFVVATICLTIFHVMLIVYIFTITYAVQNEWKELDVVQYINEVVRYDDLATKLEGFEFWAGASKLLLIVSGLISIAGIWMIYADSRSGPIVSIDDGNFSWLKFAQITRCVGVVVAILTYDSLASNITSLYSEEGLLRLISKERVDTINEQLAILCALHWAVFAYGVVMYVVVHKMQGMAISRIPQPGVVVFAAVAFFVSAVVVLCVANIWALLCAVFGAFFLVCYRKIERLSEEYNEEKEYEKQPKSNGYMPLNGWKCVCGRVNAGYVSSCACGKNKRDME